MLIIRRATPDDALAVATVHVRAWQDGFRGLIPDDYLDALRPEDRAAHYDFGASDPALPATLVAVRDGAIHGFATIGPSPETDAPSGQLHALYVEPTAWGRGIGRRLIAEARAQLHARGFREAVLWVLVGSTRAQRFYRLDGWRPDDCERTEELWGTRVHDIRFRRELP